MLRNKAELSFLAQSAGKSELNQMLVSGGLSRHRELSREAPSSPPCGGRRGQEEDSAILGRRWIMRLKQDAAYEVNISLLPDVERIL